MRFQASESRRYKGVADFFQSYGLLVLLGAIFAAMVWFGWCSCRGGPDRPAKPDQGQEKTEKTRGGNKR
ncbi:MAG: hypothetical protein ACK4Z6_00550 [Candidatus Methylomirabilales bacterium]